MLARRKQPGIERDLGRAPVRLGVGAGFELHQRRRLLGAGRDDAPRPMVLEAAPDETHAVCQQGRSQRIAGMALVFTAVEPESEQPAAVDRATDLQAERLGHNGPG